MRGIYLILFGLLGLVLLGCVSPAEEEEVETVITTDQECPGCAPADEEEEPPPVEEEPEEEVEEEVPEEEVPEEEVEEVPETAENETEEVEPPENVTGCVGPDETEYNIYIGGEVTYNGEVYEDYCTLATVVKDYYCQDGVLKDISTECPPGFDCRDGRCKQMEYSCTKTDGGDLTLKGRVTVSKGLNVVLEEFDECVDGGSVREWKCAENGTAYYEDTYCGSEKKCMEGEGRCIRSSCKEDDGGIVPEIYGTVEFEGEKYHDICISDRKLKEYYCYGESVEFETYICFNDVCDDAQCIPAPE